MANKPGKRESRTRTPPDKKRSKGLEQLTPPVQDEPEPSNSAVLSGEEIQALAIRAEDLEKLHAPRPPEDEQRPPVTSRLLVRKHRTQEKTKKTQLLVAHPATSDAARKGLDLSGQKVPHVDAHGQILPHSILGSLQELKREAAARGDTQLAGLITDPLPPTGLLESARKDGVREQAKNKKVRWAPPMQHRALENWNYHMGMRRLQMGVLSQHLGTPANDLLMNLSEDYRLIQEERNLIDRCIPAVDCGKGYRAGSEFWNQPEHIGDELSGLTMTLTQNERGYPEPLIHVRKPLTVQLETGSGYPAERSRVHSTWDKSLYRLSRRHELRQILEELNFTQPDIDGLEVIGRGRPFTSLSVSSQLLQEEEEDRPQLEKENLDPLEDYPDVVPELVLGPSLQFCGQPAHWVGGSDSHREEIGICARVTFEAVAGDKATSVLEVANDGTTAVWYEWRRLPHPASLVEIQMDHRVQRFYFNTSSGVLLPGETKSFSFLFKSPSAGIFSESWEFCTHPVLLGGAALQLSLWGIALYEDKTAEVRRALQRELEAREAVVIAQEMLQELLDGIRSPVRPQSPVDAYVTEEELFHRKNPQLYYKNQVVKEIHRLWKQYVDTPPAEEVGDSKSLPIGEILDPKSLPTSEAMLSVQDEEQREAVLGQINKGILELSFPQEETQPELLYHTCLQLWREVIDGLVSHSILLRGILGLPDKEPLGELMQELTVDPKRAGKNGKEEKRGAAAREEKKTLGGRDKEEKKGMPKPSGKDKSMDKEDRPGSRKTKGKEEKKAVKILNVTEESKELSSSVDSLDPSPPESSVALVDPAIQAQYQEKLYTQVYGLLVSLVENLVYFSEGLKNETALKEDEEVQFYM